MVHRPSAAPCQVLGPLHRMPESETEVVLQLGRGTSCSAEPLTSSMIGFIRQKPPSRRRGAGARLHEIDDSGLSRRARRVEADGVDEERSQLLPWLKLGGRGVARGQRVPPHPLYLPVPVPTRSYERRVFARASTLSLRTSQPLGSLHNSAYSRSGGHSKTAIPSQRASKRINLASP